MWVPYLGSFGRCQHCQQLYASSLLYLIAEDPISNNAPVAFARFCNCLIMICAYPVLFHPCRAAWDNVLFAYDDPNHWRHARFFILTVRFTSFAYVMLQGRITRSYLLCCCVCAISRDRPCCCWSCWFHNCKFHPSWPFLFLSL